MLDSIRSDLSLSMVRDYHAENYCIDRMAIAVTGNFAGDTDKLLQTISEAEEKAFQRLKDTQRKDRKPVRKTMLKHTNSHTRTLFIVAQIHETYPLNALSESIRDVVTYPADGDAPSLVARAWAGPLSTDHLEVLALGIAWDYLTDTTVSPLQKVLVDLNDPYCTNISVSLVSNYEVMWYCYFSNAVTEKAAEIYDIFNQAVEKECERGLDMTRMHALLNKNHMQFVSEIEGTYTSLTESS